MTKNLESKYIVLLWWIIFMFFLPWDQEKIVVINLIIFCYFLYSLISGPIQDVLEQKKQVIRGALTQSISTRVARLTSLQHEIDLVILGSNFLVLATLNFYLTSKYVNFHIPVLAAHGFLSSAFLSLSNIFADTNATAARFLLDKNLVTAHLLLAPAVNYERH